MLPLLLHMSMCSLCKVFLMFALYKEFAGWFYIMLRVCFLHVKSTFCVVLQVNMHTLSVLELSCNAR